MKKRFVKYSIGSFGAAIGVLVLILVVNGCTSLEAVYRDNGIASASKSCNSPIKDRIIGVHTEDRTEYDIKHTNYKSQQQDIELIACSSQRIAPQGFELGGLQEDKGKLYSTYDLYFLEFSGSNGNLLAKAQLDRLISGIEKEKNVYAIAYVHGWRHNAEIASYDVNKFKTLLTYSRQFLNQRVRENKIYENHRLIGIYIGWRGQVYDESDWNPDRSKESKVESAINLAGAAATILTSEKTSLKVAPNVRGVLDGISDKLKLGNGPSHNKFLVYGHSFGGNILATSLSDCTGSSPEKPRCYQDAVKGHQPGTVMRPLLGDLTLLINPAAQANKWTDIQREVDKRNFEGGGSLFSNAQPPVYVALSATGDWGESELYGGSDKQVVRKMLYPDVATKDIFPVYKVLTGNFARERRTTIGHLSPEKGAERHFGSTHDFIVNESEGNYETNLNSAKQIDRSRCVKNNGWLLNTRIRDRKVGYGYWDSGFGAKSLAFASLNPRIKYQFRGEQYFAPRTDSDVSGKALGKRNHTFHYAPYFNIPFWNVRSFQAIVDHGGYVNHPFWCAVNQIVLDDVVKQ
jgi:hypothetical protein